MINAAVVLASEGNHFWLPADFNEVIWGSIAFFIVAYLLYRFGAPPTVKYLSGRIDKIKVRLDEAEGARSAAEAERDRIKAALADSDSEAAKIVADARAAAERLAADTELRAARDAERVRERATADLAATRAQAESDLSGELARLSLGAAERVVETSLDEAAQQRLIDAYISQVGSQN